MIEESLVEIVIGIVNIEVILIDSYYTIKFRTHLKSMSYKKLILLGLSFVNSTIKNCAATIFSESANMQNIVSIVKRIAIPTYDCICFWSDCWLFLINVKERKAIWLMRSKIIVERHNQIEIT
jgi:hypothetical protein